MKNKNFVFFISSLGSGGAERQLTFLANYLVGKGHSVEINTLSDKSVQPFYKLDERVSYKPRSLTLKSKGIFSRLFYLIKRILVFSSIMRRAPKDSVLLSFMDVMNLICIVSGALAFKRVNVAERSDPNHQPSSKFVRKLVDLSYFFAKRIFVQSEAARDYFSVYITKTHVVYNAFDFTHVDKKITEKSSREIFDFISVARLSSEKKVDFLVDLFLKLEKEMPDKNFRLRVFGQGVLKDKIESKIKNSVKVEYFGASSEIYSEMVKSDLLLLASDYEGFPNVILEALSLGTPVLSTPSAGAAQIKKVLPSKALRLEPLQNFEQSIRSLLIGETSLVVPSDFDHMGLERDFGVEFVMSQWEVKLVDR